MEEASKKCVMDDPIYVTRKCKKVYNERKMMNGGWQDLGKGERGIMKGYQEIWGIMALLEYTYFKIYQSVHLIYICICIFIISIIAQSCF